MLKNKLATAATIGALVTCVGLSACGGSNASAPAATTTAATTTAATTSAPTTQSANTPAAATQSETVFWEGTLADGSYVDFAYNEMAGEAALAISKSDLSSAQIWVGAYGTKADGSFTITDKETGMVVGYTITNITSSSATMNIDGYGEVTLKPVTKADLEKFGQELGQSLSTEAEKFIQGVSSVAAAALKDVSDTVNKFVKDYEALPDSTVLYWEGTLVDGTTVDYVVDEANSQALLSVAKSDLSMVQVWYGKYAASQDGKTVTITDQESSKTVTVEVLESSSSAMKIKVENYAEADLKPVTKADFQKLVDQVTAAAAQTTPTNA